MMARIINIFKQINFKQLRFSKQRCHLCNWTLQIKLCDDEMGIRCTRCGASAVSQSLAQVFKKSTQSDHPLKVYELSSTGPFVKYLLASHHHVTLSELIDDVPLGEYVNGVICQDVQNLTYKDETFDVCTSSEVFEHVENDMRGFREIYRVLKPAGKLIFTVPIALNSTTIERTRLINGQREQILPAEYHSDKLKGVGKVFCYRNYGFDILQRLQSVGFSYTTIVIPDKNELFGLGRPVIYAEK